MKSGFDRRAMLKALGIGGALALAPGWASAAAEGRPWTIPALREWRPSGGTFEPGSPTRIVLAPRDADVLTPTADVVAADLRALLNRQVNVVIRGGEPRTGDIALRLGDDPVVGGEGYRMRLGDAAVITANTAAGTFYGTRSLLQLLAQSTRVPTGVALDWPRYRERGLMIDLGRKPFSIDWIHHHIRELAYLKLNYLHLHFTDDFGWRIHSDQGLHSDDHLTKAQVRELIELAGRYHITVVGEADMPGHMTAALRHHPEWQLRDVFGNPKEGSLDYTIEDARVFAGEIVAEYTDLFGGPYWHMGGDEYLNTFLYPLYPQLQAYGQQHGGNAKDGFRAFVNEINAQVRGGGLQLRAWNDELGGATGAVTVDSDIIVEWWADVVPINGDHLTVPKPQELLGAGHQIMNCSWYPTYYYNLEAGPPRPEPKDMYEIWAVHRFRGPVYYDATIGGPYHDIDPAEPHNLGSKLHVWNDVPQAQTEDEIAEAIHPRMRIMAQHTWESRPVVPTYPEFEQVITAVGNHPQ